MTPAARELLANFGKLPKPFWILVAGTFVNRFATFLVPFITLYLTNRGFRPTEAGVAILWYAIGGFLCGFIAGPLADRFGRNRVMGASLILEGLCVLAVGFTAEYWEIVLLMGLAGFLGQAAHPATQALISDLVPMERRVSAQLAMRLAINAGWALGPAIAGFVIQWTDDYRPLFVADAITCGVMGLVAWLLLPRGSPGGKQAMAWKPVLASVRGKPEMWGILAATLLVSIIFRQLTTTLNLHMKDHGYSEGYIGVLQAMNGAIILLAEIPLMAWLAGWSHQRALKWGFVLFGLGMFVNVCGAELWLLIAGMVIFTLGEMLALPRHSVWVQEIAPADMRGRYSGIVGFAWLGGNLIGSFGGLALYEVSPAAVWWGCGILGGLAGLCIACVRLRVESLPLSATGN